MENVLLVTIDSLRPDHVGYHGYDRDTTPFIDSLAENGSTFTNAFAHAGATQFSFPSILTGVTPLMYGGHERVSDEQTVVSEVFQGAGYRTGGFHSNLYLSADFGYSRGFDIFYDSKENSSLAGRARRLARKKLNDTPVYPLLQRAYDLLESKQGINVGSYHVPADELTDMAVEFIEETDSNQPAFLWVHYMDVHHPFLPPAEYQREFRDSVVDDHDAIKLRRKALETPDALTDAELETLFDLYDAEIRYTDTEVRRLVETAREVWDDVTVAITSDHGEHFREHGGCLSGATEYDVKLHVPLLIHGWDDTGTYDEMVGLVDLPTTLPDIVGLDVPSSYEGSSLCDMVFEDKWNRTEIMGGWGTSERTYVYRDLEWKYIEYPNVRDELYDLTTDPSESENVVDDHPDVAERLAGKLDEHRRRIVRTETAVRTVEMDENVKDRLRRLGYKE